VLPRLKDASDHIACGRFLWQRGLTAGELSVWFLGGVREARQPALTRDVCAYLKEALLAIVAHLSITLTRPEAVTEAGRLRRSW
jgi:hypothetical protein